MLGYPHANHGSTQVSPGQRDVPSELSFVVTFTYIGMSSSGLPSPPQYTVIKMLKPRMVAYTGLYNI